MNKQLERVLENYPCMVTERNSLIQQITHFKGVSLEDVIDSMYTPLNFGVYVQNKRSSDKTGQIAVNYRERSDEINHEWLEYLEKKLARMNEEINFLEASIEALYEPLRSVMKDMLLNGHTWDYLEEAYHVSRTTISRYRKKALAEMSAFYDLREMMLTEFLSTSEC